MFKKPFSTKSNTNVRNSDVRKLLKRLPEETAANLPKKAAVGHVKITTFTNTPMNVYTFDKNPLLFDFDQKTSLFPTVYATWLDPGICPMLVVHEPVLKFLENGADLMLPGVIQHSSIPFPDFPIGSPIAIGVLKKDGQVYGPMAIGCALLSSQQMLACKMQGKGVQLIHIFRDSLWEFGLRDQPPVVDFAKLMEAADAALAKDLAEMAMSDEDEENPTESTANSANPPSEETAHDEPTAAENSDITQSETQEAPEDLLYRCFLAGLKYRMGKSSPLPIDVGQFYSQCLLKCVPEGNKLDCKKTKYKKFASFLTEINKNEDGPIVKITSKGKGADVISEVNWTHRAITGFKVTNERTTDEASNNGKAILGPKITEYLAVTENVLPILKKVAGVSKGDLMQATEVREVVTMYVKSQNLQASKSVRLDPLLSSVSGITTECADWNTLIMKIQSKMTKTFVMIMPDGREIVKKIQMPKIVFKVETRSGNKKVTLVNNLISFGIEPKQISHKIQVGVAASATLGDAPNCDGQQLIVQGNQVSFIGELLQNEYGLEKKYIEGLDLAPKKKK